MAFNLLSTQQPAVSNFSATVGAGWRNARRHAAVFASPCLKAAPHLRISKIGENRRDSAIGWRVYCRASGPSNTPQSTRLSKPESFGVCPAPQSLSHQRLSHHQLSFQGVCSTKRASQRLGGIAVWSQGASLLSLSSNTMSEDARNLEAAAEATPLSPDLPPIICFPGGGMFFYWQIGVVNVIQEQIDMTKAHMSGASAGALASVLAACGVDMRQAAKHALQLSVDEKLWDRKLKLALIWGRLIRQWLEDLLPENAAELCNGRVHLFVLELPGFWTGFHCKRVPVSEFKDKSDLIDCALASVHIPIFINGHVWTEFRGVKCVDGSINADRMALNVDPRRHTLYVDPYEDPEMKERGSRFLELYGDNPGPEGTREWIEYMMKRGEEHARRIASAGHLRPWTSNALSSKAGA